MMLETQKAIKTVPHHVAIIMDGNRRWAKERDMPSAFGHWKGSEVLMDIVQDAADLGIRVLTVYAFSTENWARDDKEVSSLMQLFENCLLEKKDLMIEKGVKLDAIGDLARLPPRLVKVFLEVKQATSLGKNIELVLALSYGGRDDILRGIKSLIGDYEQGKVTKQALSESLFSQYLDTAKWPDPDLLIRTSGEKRLSNFLLWQLCYTEVVVLDVLWPDFSKTHLVQAVEEYQSRKRRKGCL